VSSKSKRRARDAKYTPPTRRYEGNLHAMYVDPLTGRLVDPIDDQRVAPESEAEKREAWGK